MSDATARPEARTARPSRAGGFLRAAVPAAGIVALGLLAYLNSLSGDLVFDDVPQIRDNPLVHRLENYLGSSAGFRALPTRYVGYLSFALNYRLSGLRLEAWHATNLAIHLSAALLVYALVQLCFRAPQLATSRLRGAARPIGFAAAALFVTHPIQTQAVSYLVQRLGSLAGLLYLATLVLYLRWRLARPPEGWRGRESAARAAPWVATALLAVHTKESAFTLPVAALLLEWTLFGPVGRRQLHGLAVLGAIALLVPLELVLHGSGAGPLLARVEGASRVQTGADRLHYLWTQLDVVARYLGLLAWPEGQNLDHDVPWATSFLEPRVLRGAAIHLALLALAGFLWRQARPAATRPIDAAARLVALGICFFYVALAVESSVIPIVDAMYEHRVYLPSAGLFLAGSVGAALLLARARSPFPARSLVAGATAAALLLAGLSLLRNRVWFTELALWQDAAAKSPGKARPLRNLGGALLNGGRPAEAVHPLRESVRLEADSAKGQAQLASALFSIGRDVEAEAAARVALRLEPDDPETLFNLGMRLGSSGRTEEARPLLARFLEVATAPGYEQARMLAQRRLGR